MVDIRIKDLPLENSPSATEFVAIDLSSTKRATVQSIVEIGRPVASQAEAEAGTNPTKAMTPLTTAQAIAVQAATAAQGALASTALQPGSIGSTVQAFDAGLQSISGLSTAADEMIYTTATDVYATTSLTPFSRTMLAQPSASAYKGTLGLATVATSANSDDLTEGATKLLMTTAERAQLTSLPANLASKAPINNPVFTSISPTTGGRISLEKPASGSTLSGNPAIDVNGDRLRLYDAGGSLLGAYLDLPTDGVASAGTSLLTESNVSLRARVAFFGWCKDYSNPLLMSRVTNPAAADWAPYYNQIIADVTTVSPKGAKIIIPNIRHGLSTVNAITSDGVYFEGPGWTARSIADGCVITCLGNSSDVFTWGTNATADTAIGGGIKGVSFNANPKTGGRVFAVRRAQFIEFDHVYVDQPQSMCLIVGSLDTTFNKCHAEGYKTTCIKVDATTFRADRVVLKDTNLAGAGTEAVPLSTGAALDIDGDVDTVDANILRIVKANRGILVQGGATRDTQPHFLTFVNLQIDYTQNENIRILTGEDIKIIGGYMNTTHSGSLVAVPNTNAAELTIIGTRMRGAWLSNVSFGGTSLIMEDCTMQDWNRSATTNPGIDLVSGFNKAKISGNEAGAVGKDGAGGAAGQRFARINAGTGRSSIYGNTFDGLHATPIENNGSGTLTVNGDNN